VGSTTWSNDVNRAGLLRQPVAYPVSDLIELPVPLFQRDLYMAPNLEAAAGLEQDDDAPVVDIPGGVGVPSSADMDSILTDGGQTAQLGVPWYTPHSTGSLRILPQEVCFKTACFC
jgi:hypothetical protein